MIKKNNEKKELSYHEIVHMEAMKEESPLYYHRVRKVLATRSVGLDSICQIMDLLVEAHFAGWCNRGEHR